MKKLGLIALGLSCVGVLSFGVSDDSPKSYAYGDYPAPQRPDLAYSEGHTGGVSKLEEHGDTPAPQRPDLALNIGDTWSPADNRGDTPAPAYDHGRPPVT
ncbi:Phr family secreted Rap phosphatase inhibitor [Bacillus sp. C1]